MQYGHQIEKMKQEWEAERKAAISKVEARTEVVKAELENLQQLYDAQFGDNKLMKEELVSYYHTNVGRTLKMQCIFYVM